MTLRGALGKKTHPTNNPTSTPTSAPANGDGPPPQQYYQRHGSAESYRSTDTVKGPGVAGVDTGVAPASHFMKLKSGQRTG
jgi:hypothetical protein